MTTITLSVSRLTEEVKRSLAIIGKRSVDDKGEPLFKDITLGTREESIIADYFNQAIVDLCTTLDRFVLLAPAGVPTASPADSLQLNLDTVPNWNSALLPGLKLALNEYLVTYCLFSWFTITAPRLSEKYLGDHKRMLASIRNLVFTKKAPTLS